MAAYHEISECAVKLRFYAVRARIGRLTRGERERLQTMTTIRTTYVYALYYLYKAWNAIFPSYRRVVRWNIYRTWIKPRKEAEQAFSMANPNCNHAREAIQEMLSNAHENVFILCHRLGASVYGNYGTVKALNDAYARNPKLKVKVYIREKAPQDSAFLTTLVRYNAEIHDNLVQNDDIKSLLENRGDVLCVDNGSLVRREMSQRERQGRLFFNSSDEACKAEALFSELEWSLRDRAPYCA